MVSVGIFATIIYAPESFLFPFIPNSFLRDLLMGSAMGLSVMTIIYSPWGKRSGAHVNPAISITFFRLGKLSAWNAFFYILAQFIGGVLGILLIQHILGDSFTNLPVNYAVTVPGVGGWLATLITETALAFGLMSLVLVVSNNRRFQQYTGLFVGILITTYITVATPISGMSINPARTFASALPADVWTGIWIYYFCPTLGMLAAAENYRQITGCSSKDICGKLCPNTETPCPFIDCPCRETELT